MKIGAILLTGLLSLSPLAMIDQPSQNPGRPAAVSQALASVGSAHKPVLSTNAVQQRDQSGTGTAQTIRQQPTIRQRPTLINSPSTNDFDWPTSSTTVLRKFDHLENNWDSGHRGVDLASRPDEQIRASGPGKVVYAGRVVDNNVISIEHTTGLRTTYMPITASVEVGDYVTTGDVIGTIEEGHCLLGACLHWGAKRGDIYYDPLSLLGSVDIRLYPVTGE